MDGVKLLNRVDTKFVIDRDSLFSILKEVHSDYRILEIEGVRQNAYETLYFDTPDLEFYHLHQRGKKNRYKVRKRKYIESDLSFLEIKFKNNKRRTIKKRITIADVEVKLDNVAREYIKEVSGIEIKLVAALWNQFTRITLVNQDLPERLTIDLGLSFRTNDETRKFEKLVIIEAKQEKATRNSPFLQAIKKRSIRPDRISKYCLGIALLNKDVKQNAFKEKIRKIEKLEDGLTA